ncbi:MAG: hypothetical protein MUC28_04560, partial [Planctomycetes bacterium]|nr:hypothetical protein [Planctomycetota bacterium]
IADPLLKYAFWHVKASDLPVRKFALLGDIANGQTVLGLNWQGQVLVSSIASQTDESGSSVKFSDIMGFNIKLAGAEGEGIFSGFLFNLNGDLIGLYDSAGKIDSIVSLRPLINGLLKNKNIKYPGLGVYYRDLSDWLYPHWPLAISPSKANFLTGRSLALTCQKAYFSRGSAIICRAIKLF